VIQLGPSGYGDAAPSFSLFGAFFPAWLFCALVGLVAALVLRGTFIVIRLDDAIPLRLVVYTAFAVLMTLGIWLTLFAGRS